MDQGFVDILKKLITEQGKEALLNPAKCKAFLADYTHGEYKKESRLLLQALDAGVPKAIDATKELEICKQQQVSILMEEHFLAAEAAADVVDALALVLREGQVSGITKGVPCSNCGKELLKEWTYCPYCSIPVSKTRPVITSDARAKYEKGKGHFNNGKYNLAIQEFDYAIMLCPFYALALAYRGDAYRLESQYDAAIKDFNEAIRLDPNDIFSYAHRGEAYRMKNQYDAAIKDLDEAINLDPNYAWAYGSRGQIYSQLGQQDQAIQDLEKAISIDSSLEWAKKDLRKIRGY